MKRAIRIHRVDFIAIVALVIGAIVVSGYILLHQPAFTLLKSYYVVKVPFSTAAAVKAGQGQTVNIAGVPVGQVGGTSLDNGTAIVTICTWDLRPTKTSEIASFRVRVASMKYWRSPTVCGSGCGGTLSLRSPPSSATSSVMKPSVNVMRSRRSMRSSLPKSSSCRAPFTRPT